MVYCVTRRKTMATLTFDTLKFVETLKVHGVPERSVGGIAEALKDAQSESDAATKLGSRS